jgi:PAS domain S-box-containing protein
MSEKPTYEELEQRVRELETFVFKHKQNEALLSESDKRLRGLFKHHSASMLLVDPETGTIIDANTAAAHFYGWSIEELQQMRIQQINTLAPETVMAKMQKAASSGSSRLEFQHRRADGSIREVEVLSNKIESAGRELLYSIVHDITDRKLAEQTVLDSENRFRAAFMGSPVALAISTMENGVCIDVNQAELAMFGYSREEIIGKSLLATNLWADPNDRQRFVFDLAQNGEVRKQNVQLRHKDGRLIIAAVSANLLTLNGVKHILFATEDITEHKLIEETLRKSIEFFKLITGHTSALFSIHDSVGNYIFASPSHEQLGYKPEELIGHSGFTMMKDEDVAPFLEFLKKAKNENKTGALLDFNLKDKKGNIHYYRGSFDAVLKPDGSIERIICVGEDITELRFAQDEKIAALTAASEINKFALVGQIAGKMAHDFNNILGVIMGNAGLALNYCSDDQTRKTLELIFDQTIRGKNLTNNLVAFGKDQLPKQEFFEIDEKMELVLDLLKKDLEGIRVVREFGSQEVPKLLGDPGMIEHAIINLLQNSIHATSRSQQPEIIVRTYHRNGWINIEIEDNGCGIPEEYLGKIYEPSFTLKGSKDKDRMYKPGIKGTGYGMSNVKRYIELHNGKITIHSKLRQGTTVAIKLPVMKQESTVTEPVEIKKETICSDKYILLVEDEQSISDVQYSILSQEPCRHKVDIAGDGQEAIDLLNRNKYDLVSLDYILPGKLNGMDIYHHIRDKNKTVPILFNSGNLEFLESIKDLMQNDPHIDHMSKPCKNIDYLNRINILLSRL